MMAVYRNLAFFVFCANAIQSLWAYSEECVLDHHHHPALLNSSEEVVFDLLNHKADDYMNGLIITDNGKGTTIYTFDDSKLHRSPIHLVFGNQNLHVMPQAHNLKVNWTETTTTTNIVITYEIGGALYKRVYQEELFSTLSSIFWSRMFAPVTADLKEKPKQVVTKTNKKVVSTNKPSKKDEVNVDQEEDDEVEDNVDVEEEEPKKTAPSKKKKGNKKVSGDAFEAASEWFDQWNYWFQNLFSGKSSEEEEEDTAEEESEQEEDDVDADSNAECPPMIELSKPANYERIAKSTYMRRAIKQKLLCVAFDNIESRWNAMSLYGAKLPIPKQASEFTICFNDTAKDNKGVAIASVVDEVWVESFFVLSGNPEKAHLEPLDSAEVFEDFPALPSRVNEDKNRRDGEAFFLDVSAPLEPDSPIEMYDNKTTIVFRYKDVEMADEQRPKYVEGVRFSGIEHRLPAGHTFVLLATTNPHVSTHFVTLVTRKGATYSVNKWHSTTGKDYRPVNLNDPDLVAQAISEISYFFVNRNQQGRLNPGQASINAIPGDFICLPTFDTDNKQTSKVCKPLKDLSNTEIVLERPNLTVLKYKANSPLGMLIAGSSVIELDTKKSESDIDIYFEQTPDAPMTIVVNSKKDSCALKETRRGSFLFIETKQSMSALPDNAKLVDVDLADTEDLDSTGIEWEHQLPENVWVLKPMKHPNTTIGSVLFNNCRVFPKSASGYMFVVSPTDEDPHVAAVFIPKADSKYTTLMLKRKMLNDAPVCAVESVDYQPQAFGTADLKKANFKSLFKA